MGYVGTFVVLSLIPYIWLAWSFIDYKNGKRERTNWKGPLALLVVLMVAVFILNLYYANEYSIPILVNTMTVFVGLIITGAIAIIASIINVFVSLRHRKNPYPEEVHNPKTAWTVIGLIFLSLTIMFVWFVPGGEKMRYVDNLNSAIAETENSNEEIDVTFVSSEDYCLRIRYCDPEYMNVFYVKNNLDQAKEVQLLIRALGKNRQEIEVIESDIMKLDPGELKMVETEETLDFKEIWGKYSFKTKEKVRDYQHQYRYRDPEE
ncbi:hypothetical protein [Tenuibacillus multivorans]|uniref:Uncharacterized protein n=1 Tax=Tenuibacillus multivorans TaxID=237069 RepID=A0A1G9WJN1_9BACI|nr:hypothetical protein [Tenuibacillus multivorans]GEL76477.1 hypothetical protein TMU01_07120 [Tenuibacillus multivorans]SDM84255.1 hypothetical protein SAMN05216498_0764 [Tenuibacillus multivorans]